MKHLLLDSLLFISHPVVFRVDQFRCRGFDYRVNPLDINKPGHPKQNKRFDGSFP